MQDLSAMLICVCHDAIGCGVVVDENRHSSQAAPPLAMCNHSKCIF